MKVDDYFRKVYLVCTRYLWYLEKDPKVNEHELEQTKKWVADLMQITLKNLSENKGE